MRRRPLRIQMQEVDATEPQSAASMKMADNQILFCQRLDVMDENLCSLGADTIRGFAALDAKIDSLFGSAPRAPNVPASVQAMPGGLPPMRRREDSTHAIEQTVERVGETIRVKAQEIVDDPDRSLTPEAAKELMKEELKVALAAQKETDRIRKLESDAAEIERKRIATDEANKQKAKEARELRRTIISGVIVGLVLLVAATAVSYTQGRAAERALPTGGQSAPADSGPASIAPRNH